MDGQSVDHEIHPPHPNIPLHPYELSPIERSTLRNSINGYKDTYSNDYVVNVSGNHEATMEILRIGRRGLPMVKEQLYDDSENLSLYPEFAKFVNVLAEKEDIAFVKNVLIDAIENRPENADTITDLSNTLLKQILEIRDSDVHDPKLHDIAITLGSACSSSLITDASTLEAVALAIVGTGDAWAEEFLDSIVVEISTAQYDWLYDVYKNADFIPRRNLTDDTWNTLLHEARGEINHEVAVMISEIDPNDTEKIQEVKRICTLAITLTNEFDSRVSLPSSWKSIAMMHAYNMLSVHPESTEDEVLAELATLEHGIQREKDAQKDDALPTIGIEVEIPEIYFPLATQAPIEYKLIQDLLYDSDVIVKRDGAVSEFVFPPSFSAGTQNALLSELRKAGYIPMSTTEFASMHINLGQRAVKEQINYGTYSSLEKHTWHSIPDAGDPDIAVAASDLLTYAFVPAGRIGSRKTITSVHLDSNTFNPRAEDLEKYIRYEFRTPRVIGPKTYRMLSEFQEIGSLLTNSDTALDTVRSEFLDDVNSLRYFYELQPNAPEDYQKHAAQEVGAAWKQKQEEIAAEKLAVLEITDPEEATQMKKQMRADREPNLIDDARSLMWYYAREVRKTLSDEDAHQDEEYIPMAAD